MIEQAIIPRPWKLPRGYRHRFLFIGSGGHWMELEADGRNPGLSFRQHKRAGSPAGQSAGLDWVAESMAFIQYGAK